MSGLIALIAIRHASAARFTRPFDVHFAAKDLRALQAGDRILGIAHFFEGNEAEVVVDCSRFHIAPCELPVFAKCRFEVLHANAIGKATNE